MSAITTKGTALVTGVSAGIGAIYADQLAKRGYNRILVASDKTRLAGLAQHRGGIRFHIANLWRLLGDGKNGARTSRRHRSAATALWRRFLRGEQRKPARINFQKLPAPRQALRNHCRVRRRPTTLAVAIEHRLTANSFVHSLM